MILSGQLAHDLGQLLPGDAGACEGAVRSALCGLDAGRLRGAGAVQDAGVQGLLDLVGQALDDPGFKGVNAHGFDVRAHFDGLDQLVGAQGDGREAVRAVGAGVGHRDPRGVVDGILSGVGHIAGDVGQVDGGDQGIELQLADDLVHGLGRDRGGRGDRGTLFSGQFLALQVPQERVTVFRAVNSIAIFHFLFLHVEFFDHRIKAALRHFLPRLFRGLCRILARLELCLDGLQLVGPLFDLFHGHRVTRFRGDLRAQFLLPCQQFLRGLSGQVKLHDL